MKIKTPLTPNPMTIMNIFNPKESKQENGKRRMLCFLKILQIIAIRQTTV